MNHFLKLNRHKLGFAFRFCSMIFTSLVLLAFLFATISGNPPDLSLVLTAVFVAGALFPCFILFIAFLAWLNKQRNKRKAFSKPPFDQLYELGFLEQPVYKESRWNFTEEIKVGRIKEFDIIADVSNENADIIVFRAMAAWRRIEKDEYMNLSRELKMHDIEFGIESFKKEYQLKNLSVSTKEELKNDLDFFISFLMQNNFHPQKIDFKSSFS